MKNVGLKHKILFSLSLVLLLAAGCAKEPDTLELVSTLEMKQRQKQMEEQAAAKAAAVSEENISAEKQNAAERADEIAKPAI